MTGHDAGRVIRLDLPIASDAELEALEGALLAARASELSQVRRRTDRQAFGYGSDSARESMTDEVDQHRLRWELLDRLLTAIKESATDAG